MLGIFNLHPVRSGAQLGHVLIVLPAVLLHVLLTQAPELFADPFAAENPQQQTAAKGDHTAVILGHDLRHEQRVEHCPKILLRNIHIGLICLDHGVRGVGDGGKNVAREHFSVRDQQAKAPVGILRLPEPDQPLVVAARQENVDVVVPRNKAAVSQRTDESAADEIKGDVIFFAKFLEKAQHIKLRQLQLPKRCGSELDKLLFHNCLKICRISKSKRP